MAVSHRVRTAGHVGAQQKRGRNCCFWAAMRRFTPVGGGRQHSAGVGGAGRAPTLQFAALNEFNVAWGTRVLDLPLFQLSAGAGYRYIQGIGIIDVQVEPGNLQAYSSLSPVFQRRLRQPGDQPQLQSANRRGPEPGRQRPRLRCGPGSRSRQGRAPGPGRHRPGQHDLGRQPAHGQRPEAQAPAARPVSAATTSSRKPPKSSPPAPTACFSTRPTRSAGPICPPSCGPVPGCA